MFPLQHRSLIISIAYSILGSYTAAEDVAQDVTEKWLLVDHQTIQNEKNYLIRLTINHCINQQKQQQRLHYKGQWLPEPVNHALLEVEKVFELKDLLTYELATQLTYINPYERAVFILKEAFEFSHQEIAQIIDKTVDNTRQILSRAKTKIKTPHLSSVISDEDKSRALQFVQYIQQGNLTQLIGLFQDDIQVFSDGGGKVTTAGIPITGAQKVANFYIKLAQQATSNTKIIYDSVLGQPAILIYQENQLQAVLVLTMQQGKIQTIYSILNPDKLQKISS